MTLERRRPLPVGRYWADIFPQNRSAFDAWLKVNASRARIESTEFKEGSGGAPDHDWVLFATSTETLWPDDVLGFAPNQADSSVTTSDDTAQKPPPEPSFADQASAALSKMQSVVYMTLGGLVVLGAAVLALSASKKRH